MTDTTQAPKYDVINPDPNYTPAPWSAVMDLETLFVDRIESNEVIAKLCLPADFDEGRMLANAHLISAAPDMFAALENMVEWHCFRGNTDEDPILDYEQQPHEVRQAMDALAKARGDANE